MNPVPDNYQEMSNREFRDWAVAAVRELREAVFAAPGDADGGESADFDERVSRMAAEVAALAAAPTWSNSPWPRADRDWEPVAGHPGVFRDPKGIWQWAARGQVPRAVLERFPEHAGKAEEEPTNNE